MVNSCALIADIGGTNARFAFCDKEGKIFDEKVVASAPFFKNPKLVVDNYFNEVGMKDKPLIGIFAIAGPVFDGRIENVDLKFFCSIKDLSKELGIPHFDIINDFVAQSLCVPYLSENDLVKIGEGGKKRTGGSIAIMGPGTGLGCGILVEMENGEYKALASEGGHVTAPAICEARTSAVIDNLLKQRKYLSAEDLISGRGLPNLYLSVKQLKDKNFSHDLTNPEITKLAMMGDKDAKETFDILFTIFGTIAGNFAISVGAVGGFYIAGGILAVPEIKEMFLKSEFRKYFDIKGSASHFAKLIPTYLITHKYPAFLGLSGLARDRIIKYCV